jgi:lycopene beta-cyclase
MKANLTFDSMLRAARTRRFIRFEISLHETLILLWTVSMVTLPILLWTLGEALLPWSVFTNVLLLATAMTLLLGRAWGWRKTVGTLAIILPASWALEYIGSTTGFPFGSYDYTARFQPQIGHVPVIIPLAWFMMLPPAWAVAQTLARGNRLAYGVISALAFTAWDLFLDPQMVGWGFWLWQEPGGYFGIPWQNFGGWLAGAGLLTALARPWNLPVRMPLLVYGITWFLQSIGTWLFWEMPGPALVGSLVMGLFLWTALWVHIRKTGRL